eukprot:CAMPEP_0201120380 /NCGR_PEP_ID=MMETSP0850-20130426/4446_1 /ASSEMBLY_ACC=CAM_ASM_000622 /TAXON_ID=183588 /ORGANISM="Pseudo-nitzschia fraudulenta, Strain WWA7" /LENGTH=611 /DNA_ID=CAMNT_0047386499 /DNA_START=122 /DNA_END=1957 /DNA_ORIENTATION=-
MNISADGGAAALAVAASSNSFDLPPGFVDDPSGFLNKIASGSGPCVGETAALAGPLAKWFRDAEEPQTVESPNPNGTAVVAAVAPQNHSARHVAHLYLRAAAKQLRVPEDPLGGGEAAAPEAAAAAAAAASENKTTKEQDDAINQNTRRRYEILEAVATAAVLCRDRSAIASSGIVPVLAKLVATTTSSGPSASLPLSTDAAASSDNIASSIATSLSGMSSSSSSSSSSRAFPPLTPAHTAFLQCAVLAEQHEFALSTIKGTWPVPTAKLKKKKGKQHGDGLHRAVLLVQKYYYLRGIVHYACGFGHYELAHRCWWTCLSVPVDVVGKDSIGIQAWKKLTLVQPLLDLSPNSRENGLDSLGSIDLRISGSSKPIDPKKMAKKHFPTHLPKCMPKELTKGIKQGTQTVVEFYWDTEETIEWDGAETDEEKGFDAVYFLLGPVVEQGDRAKAETILRRYKSTLAADGNTVMAQNCLGRVKENQVRTASKMFSVTSLEILARRWKVTPREASQQLLDAMERGVVPCRVEEHGVVVFNSESRDGSPGVAAAAASKNSTTDLIQWVTLLERFQNMDLNLSISAKYNVAKRKDEKSGGIGVTETTNKVWRSFASPLT